jgi:Ran GTPase-activating protein (RanGAP) involved in mRNA processing and transport
MCLGVQSTLTYLDISDNFGGLDPFGNPTQDGADALAQVLPQTQNLKVLKLARTFLSDANIVRISESVALLPQLLDYDIAGNNCRIFGAREVKRTVYSFCQIDREFYQGFRSLDMSGNMMTEEMMMEVGEAIKATDTVKSLKFAFSNLYDDTMSILQEALAENFSIQELDISGNPASMWWTTRTMAELHASNIVKEMEIETESFDTAQFSEEVYYTVAKKLRYLSKPKLQSLHDNPSFNVPKSQMRHSLHLLCPPSRKALLKDVKVMDPRLAARLEASRQVEKRMQASTVIAGYMMKWYEKTRERNAVAAALAAAQKALDGLNAKNDDDDEYGDKYVKF